MFTGNFDDQQSEIHTKMTNYFLKKKGFIFLAAPQDAKHQFLLLFRNIENRCLKSKTTYFKGPEGNLLLYSSLSLVENEMRRTLK